MLPAGPRSDEVRALADCVLDTSSLALPLPVFPFSSLSPGLVDCWSVRFCFCLWRRTLLSCGGCRGCDGRS